MSRPLHIVLLNYRDVTHPEAGGAETYLHEIFSRIARHGHRITWICANHRGAPRVSDDGPFRVLRVGSQATVNFAAALAAMRLAHRQHVDVFVENLCKLPFLLPLVTRTPVLPIVHHLFGGTIFQQLHPALASYVWLYEKLIPPVYRGLRMVVVSDSTARDLERRGIRASRIDVVHNGVDTRQLAAPVPAPRAPEPLLVYLGRLKRYKGLDTVIRAFGHTCRTIPQARLAMVGKGDDRPRLEQLVRDLGLADSVTFEGYVSDQVKHEWLRRAHAVVYPSPREGWGLSAIEAAACGTPVLASDVDGLRDAVRDGVTGFLIPHRDVSAWAAQMTEILSDAPLRVRLGAASRDWAARFDWDLEAEKMRCIVEEVAAGGGTRMGT